MNNRGFTLIELLIVIALIGILSAIGTFAFSQYSKKSHIANQTKLLYGDLMEYRAKALYEKKNWTFKMSAAGYGVYSSSVTTVSPVKTVTIKYPVEFDITEIGFNNQGLTLNTGAVCVAAANDAAVDSVVISETLVKLGKKKDGTDCDAANIDAK